MADYGCPACGCKDATIRKTEFHNATGVFDHGGSFEETNSDCIDEEYDDDYTCESCGRSFCTASQLCAQCDAPIDNCECEKCERCTEIESDCYCRGCAECEEKPLACECDGGWVRPPLMKKRRINNKKHVNPMARFAYDQTRA